MRHIAVVVTVAFCAGCSYPVTPSAPLLMPDWDEKIPLWAALSMEREFQSAQYFTHVGGDPKLSPVRVNVGKSSVELFREGLPRIFAKVEEAYALVPSGDYHLLLVPHVTYTAGISSKGYYANVEYKLDVINRRGENAVVSSGVAEGVYDARMTLLDLLFLPITAPLIILTGVGTSDARDYSRAFAEAEAKAFRELTARLRSSSFVAKTVEDIRKNQEYASVAPQEKSLDEQLSALMEALAADIPRTPTRRIAVAQFSRIDGKPASFEAFLEEELLRRLVSAKTHTVVERALLSKALQELRLNQADLVDPKHAKDLGRFTGADAVLAGSTADLGHWVKVSVRLVETETGAIIGAASANIFKHEQVKKLLK
jgi:TolB-like protein